MNKLVALFTTFLMAICTLHTSAQNNEIEVTEGGFFKNNKTYTKCGIQLTDNQILELIKTDAVMKTYYKPVALNYAANLLLKSTASLLILWPVTESLSGSEHPNWDLAYVGAACAVLSIPFKRGFEKNTRKAVDAYNASFKPNDPVGFKLNIKANGVGIAMNF